MLGRCRLRRGVSLEVIVEEDDTAEVALDPTPLPEEDDDDDEEEDVDSEHGARGSAPSSPRGRGGEGGGEATAAEERRRRRERRRTIGGLSRIRSVSCEALTLLDTSDMDMCCSEWDDDDDLATTSSNYVTLNRPISRRRILESSQTQCDSEDSGIEYQSNEDDPALEDRSSAEDHSCEDPMQVDIHEAETATESEGEEVEEEREEEEEEERSSSPSPSQATLPEEDTCPGLRQGHEEGVLATGTSAKHVFEDRVAQPAKGNQTTTPKFAPTEALENDKVVIVETTPPVPTRRPAQHEGALDPAEEELQLKRAAYTIRNKEVRLAELPKPDTVRSVKGQLFEEAASPCSTPRLEGPRFDSTIKSNSASKILASTGARATPAGEVTASATDPNPAEAAQPRGAGPAKVHPAHSHLAPTSCWLSCGGTKESQKGLAAPQPRPARRPQHVVAPHALRGAQEARGARLQRQEGPARGPQELPPPQHESKKERRRRPAPARARRRRRHSTRTREKAHTTGTHVGGERGGGLRPCDTNTRNDIIDRSDTESLASDSDDSGVSNDSTVCRQRHVSHISRPRRLAADPSFSEIKLEQKKVQLSDDLDLQTSPK
nr:neurofilament heavy polypeptide-like [Penaeus vannamei]